MDHLVSTERADAAVVFVAVSAFVIFFHGQVRVRGGWVGGFLGFFVVRVGEGVDLELLQGHEGCFALYAVD